MLARDETQAKRFATFGITREDVACLATLRTYTSERLPALLARLHDAFAEWPAIHQAVLDPEVDRLRVSHWCRVVSGRIDDGFEDSATALADAFYRHRVPAYAVAICHASVAAGIVRDLGLDRRALRGASRRRAHRDALAKITWLDLEVLL